jgi:hypothetical protein
MFCFCIGCVWIVWYVLFFYWICLDSVVCFVFLLDMFGQCGMFCFSIGYVWTVWYVLFFYWICLDSVVCFVFLLDMFGQSGKTKNKTYHTVQTYPIEKQNIPYCPNISNRKTKHTTLSKHIQ